MEFDLGNPVEWFTPGFIILILIELVYGRRTGKVRFEPRDTATSMVMGFGGQVIRFFLAFMVIDTYLYAFQYRLTDIGFQWWAWVICFIGDDLAYYAFHRVSHRVRWFWASHVIHHTSQHYNLSTALRQSWTNQIGVTFFFRIPILLIGFRPEMLFFCVALNLIYQFWIHTEAIDRLPRWFEAVMNTPSHHRVHHATNPRYLDANYAGVFIVWDRMFGSFVAETRADPPHYGIIQNLGTFNPLKVAFHEWIALFRDIISARSLDAVYGFLFRAPGWTPDGSRQTTEMIKRDWRAREAKKQPAEQPAK